MILYRPFLNTDPPRLAEIWRSNAERRGLMQPMSALLFEQHVLSKPYFDRQGLLIATDESVPVGFAHAGFGPNAALSSLERDLGVTSLLVVHPTLQAQGIEQELLAHSENYLIGRGAKVLYGGSIFPLNPFYVGLYGGSEMPGILDSDASIQELFREQGYREIDRVLVFQRTVADFRAPVDRQLMQIRRRSQMAIVNEPPTHTWWQACTLGEFERTEYQLLDRTLGNTLASATFRNVDHPVGTTGLRTTGLIDVHVDPGALRQGMATFLLAESMKQMQELGVGLVEAQTMERNTAAVALYKKLGFVQVDAGRVYRKEGSL